MLAALIALALQAAAPSSADAPRFRGEGQMKVFDMICGRVFPDEARIDSIMAKLPGARALTPTEMKDYLRDDPGHGWVMQAGTGNMVVTLEAPPVHACAVRMTNTDGVIDEGVWQQLIAAAQARGGGGFTTLPPRTIELGAIQSKVSGVQKQGADGAAEAIYLIRTLPKPARPPAQGGIEIRMVRQLVQARR